MTIDVDALSEEQQILVLAHIAFVLPVSARGTYEAGTDKVLKPELLRRFNELQHRISASAWEHLMKKGGIPLETIIEMIRDFGKDTNNEQEMEWVLKTVDEWIKAHLLKNSH